VASGLIGREDMEYRQLGHSGLRVSKLCLGTMTFGEADETSFMHNVGCDEATAARIMDEALTRASTSSTPPTCTATTGSRSR
jgi:hypothetical protein